MAAVTELGVEYPNIRSALAWAVHANETQLGLRLAGTLDFLWQTYGSVNEGMQWVEKLLAMPGADEPTTARAWALLSAGYLAHLHGDFEQGRAFCHEALAIGRSVADGVLEWEALLFWAINRFTAGDLVTAVGYGQQALACARTAKDPITEAQSLCVLALIACARADFTTAQPLAEQAQRLGRADPWIEAWSLAALGRAAHGQGAFEHARAVLEAGLALARQQGDPPSLTAFILDALGDVGTALNQPRIARTWLLSSLELRREGGERVLIAQTLDRLAALADMCGEAEFAFRLAGAADALYDGLGSQRGLAERHKLERWLLPLREQHGGEAADRAWVEGRALGLDDAIAFALSSDQGQAEQPTSPEPAHVESVLSSREEEVAVLLARGLTNRRIADELVISIHTAERHVENILGKLGFSSRTQVAAWAIGQGLVPAAAVDAPR
jgi:DNA-binding CsgD family transcriptional regulator